LPEPEDFQSLIHKSCFCFGTYAKDILGEMPSPKRKDRMTGQYHSYLNPKCDSGPLKDKGGCGIFAREPIKKGELLCLWGGRVIAEDEIDYNMPNLTQRVLQVDENLYLLTPEILEPSDCFNHSCEPNAGFTGQIGLLAMRDIEMGEEVCMDYAMCDSKPYDEFDCHCGSENCRGRVTGNDWERPDLQAQYKGYFSPYLAKRIEALKTELSAVG
jgi:uncharacterized protein